MDNKTLIQNFTKTHTNFFSNLEIGLSYENFMNIKKVISSVETELSRNIDFKKEPSGVFMSYDFHIIDEGPKLIEINTNAGGAVLFQKYLESVTPKNQTTNFDLGVIQMFEQEWKKAGKQQDLQTILILDNNPLEQVLYTEFLLIKNILKNAGYKVFISDPKDLKLQNNSLIFDNQIIDLVYNRHTDFYLVSDQLKNIKAAYENQTILLTPNPKIFNTFANKKHLIELSQQEGLRDFIPKTILISESNKDRLWTERKKYFFKPLTGHGSKGVYCGKKITSKVWSEISNSNYLAQICTQPKRIPVTVKNEVVALKYDLRFITYEGTVIYMFARVYSGQATNMKTEGGGFAKIVLGTAT